MKATLSNAKMLKKTVAILNDLLSELHFTASAADGLCMTTMDESHVALVHLALPPPCFALWDIPGDVRLISVKRADLDRVLRVADDTDELTLALDVGASKLTIETLARNSPSARRGTYAVDLIEVDDTAFVFRDTGHAAIVKLPAAAFAKDIESLKNFEDVVELAIGKDAATMRNVGMKITLRNGTQAEVISAPESPLNNSFALPYLRKFARASALCATVQIGMSDDLPLYVTYALGGGAKLCFVLAPKLTQ